MRAQRYPDRSSLVGTAHVLLVPGQAEEAVLAAFGHRWRGLVDVVRTPAELDRPEPEPLTALIRPDGYVGYRLTPTDAAGLAALDRHLTRYLVPTTT